MGLTEGRNDGTEVVGINVGESVLVGTRVGLIVGATVT